MTSLFFDIFGRDNGATRAFQNVGTAADNAGTRLAALNTQWKAAAAAEQEATTAMETAAQRETTARSTAEAATTRLRDAETQLEQVRTAVASSAENVAAAEQRVSTARRDAAAAEQELASAEQNTVAAAERLTTAHNNASNAARQHSTALKEVENSTRRLGTETDNLISKFRNVNLGSTMFAAIGASIQPLLASIGQLSGALGLLPAAATAVGTAFGAAVIGVQGMGTALKDASTAEKDAQAAAQADATAQQAVGQAHTAAAAAGQQNVASLKQLVAEGAAHIASLKAQQAAGQNVTTELKAAETAQAANVAALKNAQAAATGNVGALNSYTGAQKTANTAVSEADAAHKKAKASADAYAASLKNLAPSAQQVVSAIIQLKPAFDGLRLDVQQHLFQGIGDQLLQLGQSVLPVVQTGLSQMAGALNNAMKQVSEFAQQKSSIEAYKQIFSDNADAANTLTGAIRPILQIFTDVASVGAPLLKELAQHFKDAADRAAEFVSKAKESGDLKKWIQQGIDAVRELWGAIKDVVAIIKDLATTQGFGPNFLEALKAVTGAIRWFIENVPGATTLVQAFFDAWLFAKIVSGLAGMVKSITDVIGMLKKLVTANEEAAVAGEASAARFSNAWKTAAAAIGIAALAVGADALLPKNTPQEEQQAKDHPLTSGYGAANRDELSGIAGAIKDPGKALDDLKQELNAFPGQFQNSPFMNFFRTLPITIQTALSGIGGVFQTMWNTIKQGANDFANGFKAPFDSVITFVRGIPAKIQAALGDAKQWIAQKAQDMWDGFTTKLNTAWNSVVTWLRGIPQKILTALGDAKQWIAQKAQDMWDGFKAKLDTAWNTIVTWLKDVPNKIKTAIGDLKDTLVQKAQDLLQGFLDKLNQKWTDVVNWIKDIPNKIKTAIGDLASALTQPGTSAMQGFYNSMVNFYNNTIKPWLQSIAQSIQNLKGPVSKDYYILHDAGTAIMAGLHDSMQTRWERIVAWLRSLRGEIGGHVGGIGSQITAVTTTIGTSSLQRMTSSMDFGGGGGIASYAHTVTAPMTQIIPPSTPTVPSPSRGGGYGGRGGDPIVIRFEPTGNKLEDAMFDVLRNRIRVKGGNVQLVLGQ